MKKSNITLMAVAFAGAMLATSAGAVDQNNSATFDSGDRGVVTPSSVEQTPTVEHRSPGGQAAIPRGTNPMNPNESRPFAQQPEAVRIQARGDNLNMPNPTTPSGANESAARTLMDQTNTTGMGGYGPVGGTR